MGAVGTEELRRLLVHLWRMASVKRYCPLLVWGEAGIGKSDSVRTAADALGIDFQDVRLANMEAPDLMGLMRDDFVYPCLFDLQDPEHDPLVTGERFSQTGLWHHCKVAHPERIPAELQDKPLEFVDWLLKKTKEAGYGVYIEKRTVYSAPMWFPEPGTAGILFLDEANRSNRDTRQGVFQLLLDRRIHELELPPGWIIVAACNPSASMSNEAFSSYGDVDEISDRAFLSRLCHVVLSTSRDEWISWARKAGVDESIWSVVSNDPSDKLLGLKAGLQIPSIDPSPRSWAILSEILEDVPGADGGAPSILDPRLRGIVAEGMLGIEVGRKFSAWCDEADAIDSRARNGSFLEETPGLLFLLERATDRANLQAPTNDDAEYILNVVTAALSALPEDDVRRHASTWTSPGIQQAISNWEPSVDMMRLASSVQKKPLMERAREQLKAMWRTK